MLHCRDRTVAGHGRARLRAIGCMPAISSSTEASLAGHRGPDRQRRHRLDDDCDRARAPHDAAWTRPPLRRHGPGQERPLRADAMLRDRRARHRAVDRLRLQPGVRRRRHFRRRIRQGLPRGPHAGVGRRHHPRVGVRDVPDDVRDHHAGPHGRRLRRTHEVRRTRRLRRRLVHGRLRAARAHGVGRPRRAHVGLGRSRLRGRHGRARQRRHRGPDRGARDRPPPRLSGHGDPAAQRALRAGRRGAAVGRLVRLQCGQRAGRERDRGNGACW